ncbi:Alpha/Beta hydrolase protein [Polychytrium aggregatum]|uniref:Alpha/Beta hydrolase protein n=1 Tax=Polychytrium aggregatum TaxID=110093 RepID=UPI0022FF2376|nr:Alpha/Beta hydrolase protein [Polychytrium aggregatum]KAI9193669.1 Alpha/Beta hydrolase protein [Polychytrium aggregatum]
MTWIQSLLSLGCLAAVVGRVASLSGVVENPTAQPWNVSRLADPGSIDAAFSTKTVVDDQGLQWSVWTHVQFTDYALRVTSNSTLCDPNVAQIHGYIDVGIGKHFFFWFFESRRNPSTDPLFLWLNGGPGSSSLIGLFMELGPCQVRAGGTGTTVNPYSWNSIGNIIFLDQPVDTGFSYSDNASAATFTSADAAKDVYAFLQIFLAANSQYRHLPFHTLGESYGGHYVPAVARAIVDNNANATANATSGLLPINLVSIAIGNGITDPLNQYSSYPLMAADTKYGPIVGSDVIATVQAAVPTCLNMIRGCYQTLNSGICSNATDYCNTYVLDGAFVNNRNIYDMRVKCSVNVVDCSDYPMMDDISTYLNLNSTLVSLGLNRTFVMSSDVVYSRFTGSGDWMMPYVNDIPPVMAKGISVLIYAGDADYICNWIGNKAWVLNLTWPGQRQFQNTSDLIWISPSTKQPAGEIRSYDTFNFMKIYGAGHLVPYDQPQVALDMITAWTNSSKYFVKGSTEPSASAASDLSVSRRQGVVWAAIAIVLSSLVSISGIF